MNTPSPLLSRAAARSTWTAHAIWLLALAIGAPIARAQDESPERLRSFSLSEWERSRFDAPPRLSPVIPRPIDWEDFDPEPEVDDWIGLPRVLWSRLLDRLLDDAPDAGPEFELAPDDRAILAFGTDSQLDYLDRSLAVLREQFLRTIDLRVTVLELDPSDAPETMPTVMSRADAEVLRQSVPARVDRRERILAGELEGVFDERKGPFVRDYETEVSRATAVVDPRMGLLRDGVRIWLHAGETFDDRVHLDVQLEIGDRDDAIDERRTGAEHMGLLQTPNLRETWASFHAPVSPSESLAFWSIGPESLGPSFVVLFEATRVTDSETDATSTDGPFLERMPLDSLRRPTRLGDRRFQSLPRRDYYDDPSERSEAVEFGDVIEQVADWTNGRDIGGHLVFVDREDAARARSMLEPVVDQALSRCSVNVAFRQDGCRMDFAAPAQFGGRFAISRGFTTWQLADYEVEIAEGTAVGNPNTSIVFDGLLCDVQVFDRNNSGATTKAYVHAERHSFDPLRVIDLEATHLGSLFVHDQRLQRFDHRGPLDDGRVRIEATSRDPQRSASLEIEIRSAGR